MKIFLNVRNRHVFIKSESLDAVCYVFKIAIFKTFYICQNLFRGNQMILNNFFWVFLNHIFFQSSEKKNSNSGSVFRIEKKDEK